MLHSIGETFVDQLRHVCQFSSESNQAAYFQRWTDLLFQKVDYLGGRIEMCIHAGILHYGFFECLLEIEMIVRVCQNSTNAGWKPNNHIAQGSALGIELYIEQYAL